MRCAIRGNGYRREISAVAWMPAGQHLRWRSRCKNKGRHAATQLDKRRRGFDLCFLTDITQSMVCLVLPLTYVRQICHI